MSCACPPMHAPGAGCSQAGWTAHATLPSQEAPHMLWSSGAGACAQAQPQARVLLCCTENMTANSYQGTKRSCLITNCLFRLGCAVSLLSNWRAPRLAISCQFMGSQRMLHCTLPGPRLPPQSA